MPRRLRHSKRRDDAPVSARELFLSTIGPRPSDLQRAGLDVAAELERWRAWNRSYGVAWRARRGCPRRGDDVDLVPREQRGLEAVVPAPPDALADRGAC